jgi:hypothetical protein
MRVLPPGVARADALAALQCALCLLEGPRAALALRWEEGSGGGKGGAGGGAVALLRGLRALRERMAAARFGAHTVPR